jgi:hypothetical protein
MWVACFLRVVDSRATQVTTVPTTFYNSKSPRTEVTSTRILAEDLAIRGQLLIGDWRRRPHRMPDPNDQWLVDYLETLR